LIKKLLDKAKEFDTFDREADNGDRSKKLYGLAALYEYT
jgi:hypothetical protein